jgi:AraC family transcriptional regulator
MTPRIEFLSEKKLVGQHVTMSLADNKTGQLWSSFMPRRREIVNAVNKDLISMQVYDNSLYFNALNPHAAFEKWAAVEVSDFDNVPDGMEVFTLSAGLYAVFPYKGDARGAAAFFNQIFTVWLPNSDYALADRPHFEVLDERYKNNQPDSEEDVWIPIK